MAGAEKKIVKKDTSIVMTKSVQKEVDKLQDQISFETEKRKLLTTYIRDHLVEGTDYGKIHVNSKCESKYNCKIESHFSKPTLFKSGSEKFMSLLHLVPKFKKDIETWEMLGSKAGVVSYICELYNVKGEMMGEGRGVATTFERQSEPLNGVVKKAEKRAQMDAILRTGGLSDVFTQDLEDSPPSDDVGANKLSPPKSKPAENRSTTTKGHPLTTKQLDHINDLLKRKKRSSAAILKRYGIRTIGELDTKQASDTIAALYKLPDVKSAPPQTPPPGGNMNEDVDPDSVPL